VAKGSPTSLRALSSTLVSSKRYWRESSREVDPQGAQLLLALWVIGRAKYASEPHRCFVVLGGVAACHCLFL
jgi:hypothetical protein